MKSCSNHQVHLQIVWKQPHQMAFDQAVGRLRITFRKESHRRMFLSRNYKTISDLETALKRYRVFGDLSF